MNHKINVGIAMTIISSLVFMMGCGGAVSKQSSVNDDNTFTDPRDNKTYRTVTIGNQTWMAENLNYKDSSWAHNDITTSVRIGDKGSWCYNNSADSCARYGRLYTWDAAMEACPAGWRLPDGDDWDTLIVAVGGDLDNDGIPAGTKLKSSDYWQPYAGIPTGEGDDGFSALPGGHRSYDGTFYNAGLSGDWWVATDSDYVVLWLMGYDYESVRTLVGYEATGIAVRCIRND